MTLTMINTQTNLHPNRATRASLRANAAIAACGGGYGGGGGGGGEGGGGGFFGVFGVGIVGFGVQVVEVRFGEGENSGVVVLWEFLRGAKRRVRINYASDVFLVLFSFLLLRILLHPPIPFQVELKGASGVLRPGVVQRIVRVLLFHDNVEKIAVTITSLEQLPLDLPSSTSRFLINTPRRASSFHSILT